MDRDRISRHQNTDEEIIELQLKQAEAASDLENFEECYRLLNSVLEIQPDNVEAICGIHRLAFYPEKWKYRRKCISFMKRVSEKYLNEPEIHYWRGLYYVMHKNKSLRYLGEDEVRQVLELEPENSKAWWVLGLFYQREFKDYEKAAAYLEKAVELSNGYIGHNDPDTGKFIAEEEVNPSSMVLADLARVYILMDRDEDAINTLKWQIKLDPYYSGGYCELATLYEKKGLMQEALDVWNELLIQVTPENLHKSEMDWHFIPNGIKRIEDDQDHARKHILALEKKLKKSDSSFTKGRN